MSVRQDQVQVNVEINGAKAGASLKEIKSEVKQLYRELDQLPVGTQAWYDKLAQIKDAKKPIDDARDAVKGVNAAMKETTASGEGFKGKLLSIGNILTGGLLLGGIQAIVGGIKNIFSAAIVDARDAQRSTDQLTQSLNGNVEAATRLAEQADTIEKSLNGLFSAEDVQDAQATLAIYTQEADAIEALTPKILDLAAAKGVDLKTAADAVGRTLEGNGDALKKMGISVKEATTEEERLAVIVDGLTAKVGGQAEVVAASTKTGWDGLKITLGDLAERIANNLLPFINQLGDFLNTLVKRSEPLVSVFRGMFTVFGQVWDQVKQLLASFGLMNEKTSASDLIIKALTKAFSVLGTFLTSVGKDVRKVIEFFNEFVARSAGGAAAIVTTFTSLKDFFVNVFSNVGQVLKGVFTLDLDEIKAGVANLKGTYTTLGQDVFTAYATGYKTVKDRQKAVADQEDEAETKVQVAKAGARGKAAAAKEGDEKTKEQKKQEDLEKKRNEERLAKLAELEAQVQDIRISAMKEGEAKERAQENLRYERELQAFTKRINDLRALGATEAQVADENAAFREAAEEAHENKLLDITIKSADKKRAEDKKSDDEKLKQKTDDYKAEIDATNLFYDTLIAGIRAQEAAKAEASGGGPEEIAAIREASADAQLLVEIRKNEELLNINKEYGESTIEQENFLSDQRLAAAEKFASGKKALEQSVKDTLRGGFDFAIQLMSQDEAARKKNAAAIKAFTAAKIFVDLQSEIQGIWLNANRNAINALIPGAGNILAGIQTGLALGRASLAVNNVNKQQFARGGHTGPGMGFGDNTGHPVAGVVHAHEWVSPKWMTQHPYYGHVIHQLEDVRVRGFADGGFTTTPTAMSFPTNSLTDSKLDQLIAIVAEWPREVQARVVYSEFESIQNGVNDVRSKASIG